MNEALALIFGFLSIINVSCKTQYGPCDEDDYKRLEEYKGQNLLLISSDDAKGVLEQSFKNEEVSIHKILPNTLSAVVEKRRAYVGMTKNTFDGSFLVSKDGTVLGFEKNTALPTITLSEDFANPIVGDKVNEDVIKAARTILLVTKITHIKKVLLETEKLTVDTNETQVVFPKGGDPEVLVGALQLILSHSKMDEKLPVSIDLRYKNPVLKY